MTTFSASVNGEVARMYHQMSLETNTQVARSQWVCRSVRQRGGYARKRSDWSHPQQFIFLTVWLEGLRCYWVWDHWEKMCGWDREDGGCTDYFSWSSSILMFFLNKTYTWILLRVNFYGSEYIRLYEQLLFVNTRTGGVCQIIPNLKKTHGCIMQEPHIPPFPCSHVTEADGLKWSVNKLEHKAN